MSVRGLIEAVNEAMRPVEPVAGFECRGLVDDGVAFVGLRTGGEEARRLTLLEAEALGQALLDAADAAAVLADIEARGLGEAAP